MYTLLLQLLFYKNKGASTNELSRLADFAGVEGGGGFVGICSKKEICEENLFFRMCMKF